MRVAEPLVVGRRGEAGEAVVAGRVVVLHRVLQAADDGELVGHRGELRDALAEDARRASWSCVGLVPAADVVRARRASGRTFVLARAAPLVQEDDGLRGGLGLRLRRRRRREQLREGKPEEAAPPTRRAERRVTSRISIISSARTSCYSPPPRGLFPAQHNTGWVGAATRPSLPLRGIAAAVEHGDHLDAFAREPVVHDLTESADSFCPDSGADLSPRLGPIRDLVECRKDLRHKLHAQSCTALFEKLAAGDHVESGLGQGLEQRHSVAAPAHQFVAEL